MQQSPSKGNWPQVETDLGVHAAEIDDQLNHNSAAAVTPLGRQH